MDLVRITTQNIEDYRGGLGLRPGDLPFEMWQVFDHSAFDACKTGMIVPIQKNVSTKNQLLDPKYSAGHYILRPNAENPFKCELQVRTLADEIWGEVSHQIDYPEETKSIACKEQLKVLARLTSGCIRLVDSVFGLKKEHEELSK